LTVLPKSNPETRSRFYLFYNFLLCARRLLDGAAARVLNGNMAKKPRSTCIHNSSIFKDQKK